MANGAKAVTKARERTSASQGRKGKGSFPRRRKTSAPDSRRRRANSSSNPRERFEHYMALARTAATAGDAVESENNYQHAEHYLRLMNRKAMGSEASQCGGSLRVRPESL